jgi:NAD(P)H-hydrate repair Nnr-like enzyme with NAD(P)H-hydrate dehydratase domain
LLTGLITAFCAQGLSPGSAALCGAYLHGLAADLLVKRSGDRGFKAGDVLDLFPAAFRETVELPGAQPGELYQISR